jgi:hypothetical protein
MKMPDRFLSDVGGAIRRHVTMRSIFAGMIVLSALIAVVHTADAQKYNQGQAGSGYMRAPVDHPHQNNDDVEKIENDNKQLDLPASQDKTIGADQVQSEENAFGKLIEQENERLDRHLKGICRGC